MVKYKVFNVAANKDEDKIFLAFMVELIDREDTADLIELKSYISAVFSTVDNPEFRFTILEGTNPLSKEMLLDANERFLPNGAVDFREKLSAIGTILKSNSEEFKKVRLVNISFKYVVRKGRGRNVCIVDGSEKPIGKFTTKFIQLFPSVQENILAEQ